MTSEQEHDPTGQPTPDTSALSPSACAEDRDGAHVKNVRAFEIRLTNSLNGIGIRHDVESGAR